MLFAQSICSTLRSSQHSMSSVTVYTRLCMIMCISKCMYLVYTYLEQMSSMCVYDDTSRLDSYSHTVYEMMNDDESLDQTYYMCDVSRLDSYKNYEYLDQEKLSELDQFLCQDSQIFMPVMLTNRPFDATLAQSTIPQHITYRFITHSIWILFRLPNLIKHSFIFKKPFIN